MKWTRIDRPLVLPEYVRNAVTTLSAAGHVAYVVGGSVRDFLLNRPSKDHDIATDATPDEIEALFPHAIEVGKAFGVIKIPIPGIEHPLEIATFRKDLEYKDHRHPVGVEFADPLEDAKRRDFTINGLFYDPKTMRVLDCVNGIEDIIGKKIRAIGNAEERFKEDALRLVRAVRFASTLNFEIEESTSLAIVNKARLIAKVSAERIRDELTQMLCGPNPGDAVKLLSRLELLPWLLPEVESLKRIEKLFDRTLKGMNLLARDVPKRSPALAWSALLLDIGKPSLAKSGGSDRVLVGYEREGARLARKIGERFKMPGDWIERISSQIEEMLKFQEVFRMREATLERFVRQDGFDELLALHRADAIVTDGNLAGYEFCRERRERALELDAQGGTRKLLSGEDLIALGLAPGPRFAEILREIEDLQLERKLSSKDEAMEYVLKHFSG